MYPCVYGTASARMVAVATESNIELSSIYRGCVVEVAGDCTPSVEDGCSQTVPTSLQLPLGTLSLPTPGYTVVHSSTQSGYTVVHNHGTQ